MSVARFKANPQWFRPAAKAMRDYPKLARELERAAKRPGRTAELTLAEIRVLAERYPHHVAVQVAWGQAEASAIREAEGAKRLRAQLDKRRGGPS